MKLSVPFRCRCSLRCAAKFIAVVFAVIVVVALYPNIVPHTDESLQQCTDGDSKRLLQSLCRNYTKGLLGGPLCLPLCKNMSISYDQCLGHGNKIVLKARWIDRWIVLKASKPSMMDYYHSWNRDDLDIRMTQTEVGHWAYKRVKSEVKPYSIDKALVRDRLLSFLPVMKGRNYSRADVESLWSVLEQDEFLKFFLFADNKHFPNVYGWCGHVYAMEYTQTYNVFHRMLFGFRHTMPWKSRVKVALSYLEMVHSLKQTPYGELSLCDVQESNFGLRALDFTVQAIDIDLALLPEAVSKNVRQAATCMKDSECDFFDCVAYCDHKTQKCTSQLKSSNFQNVCRDIFRSKHRGRQGLLERAPESVAYELGDILIKCSSTPSNSTVKFPPTYYSDLYDRLYSLLSKEIQ